MTSYNGWKSYTEWNCSLWINNDYSMYKFVLGLVNSKVTDWKDVAHLLTVTFNSTTPDGVAWVKADETEMNAMLAEMLD